MKEITGLMVYYYAVCKRKLWYFYNSIDMEQNSGNVYIGKLLDENTYKREEKHINIDNVINVDFIKKAGHYTRGQKKQENRGSEYYTGEILSLLFKTARRRGHNRKVRLSPFKGKRGSYFDTRG